MVATCTGLNRGRLKAVEASSSGGQLTARPWMSCLLSFSARTRVHEYGGSSYVARNGVVWFRFHDQRVSRVEPDGEPEPVSAQPRVPASVRFADMALVPDGRWLVGVRETHGDSVINDVAVLAADGSGAALTLVDGRDFFAAPRISPDGEQLAWLGWDFPNMPWDGTELYVAPLNADMTLGSRRLVAGGPTESVSQPRWSPDGRLHFLSDRTGWWNLYADDGRAGRPLWQKTAEFGGPDWALGQATYTFLTDGTLVTRWEEAGRSHLAVLATDGAVREIAVRCTSFASLAGGTAAVWTVGASDTMFPSLMRISIPDGRVNLITPRDTTIDGPYISIAEPIAF